MVGWDRIIATYSEPLLSGEFPTINNVNMVYGLSKFYLFTN